MHCTGIILKIIRQKIWSILCSNRSANDEYSGGNGICRAVTTGKLTGSIADICNDMMVTIFGRLCTFSKIFGIDLAAAWIRITDTGDCKFSGFLADLGCNDPGWLCEILIFQIFVDAAHNRFPDFLWISGLTAGLWRVIIKSTPYNTGIIWCEAGKQCITVFGCCTGFSGLGHRASKVSRGTGSLSHNVFHGIG